MVCVIGDGALSAGMAYEAMNNAGHLGKRLIVILNDNDMSISPPVGAMSSHLVKLYSERPFQDFKALAKGAVSLLPPPLREGAERARGLVKDMRRRRLAVRGSRLLLCRPGRRARHGPAAARAAHRAASAPTGRC